MKTLNRHAFPIAFSPFLLLPAVFVYATIRDAGSIPTFADGVTVIGGAAVIQMVLIGFFVAFWQLDNTHAALEVEQAKTEEFE